MIAPSLGRLEEKYDWLAKEVEKESSDLVEVWQYIHANVPALAERISKVEGILVGGWRQPPSPPESLPPPQD